MDGVRKTEEKREMKERWMKDDRNMTEQGMNESGGGKKRWESEKKEQLSWADFKRWGRRGFQSLDLERKDRRRAK